MGKKNTTSISETLEIKQHISTLIRYMAEGIYEKEHIMSLALLAAIAGESIFLLGPPGTAKSMVARRLKMVFKDANAFEYLMSRFSTPDEIFGPVSISKLKNDDKYERLTEGYLPQADIVFLDEIWKAGPSIQNALLTAINERIFKNGSETIHLPMKTLIAASNELPAEDEGLEALWDRFLVRIVSNCISNENNFYKMLRNNGTQEPDIPIENLITNEQYHKWQKEIHQVEIPDEICHFITSIRKRFSEELKKEETVPMDYYISDRRWKKAVHLLQTSAWINGRVSVDLTDCVLLIHCLWNKAETISKTLDIISSAFTSEIETAVEKAKKTLDKLIKQHATSTPQEQVSVIGEDEIYEVVSYFYYALAGFPQGTCLFSKADYNIIGNNKPTDGILYYQEKNKQWMVRTLSASTSFINKTESNEITKVTLQKCNGGVIINGIPYSFKRKDASTSDFAGDSMAPYANIETIQADYHTVTQKLTSMQKSFNQCDNLFVSKEDKKLVITQLCKMEKSLNELRLKIENTQLLFQR